VLGLDRLDLGDVRQLLVNDDGRGREPFGHREEQVLVADDQHRGSTIPPHGASLHLVAAVREEPAALAQGLLEVRAGR
jgi:hypothetical protein